MCVYPDIALSSDGVVLEKELDDDGSTVFLREVRKAKPDGGPGDILVLARLAHEVLTETSESRLWPLFSASAPSKASSLFKAMVLASRAEDAEALEGASDEDVLVASNIARWLIGIPQQTSTAATVVFVDPPVGRVPSQHLRRAAATVR